MPTLQPLEALLHTPASDVKKEGWRAIAKEAVRKGALVVTNHGEPEVIILSIERYEEIATQLDESSARQVEALSELRARFDQRLARLRAADAGDALRATMAKPAKLRGKVKAGASY